MMGGGGEAGDGPNKKIDYSYIDIFKYYTSFSIIDFVFLLLHILWKFC